MAKKSKPPAKFPHQKKPPLSFRYVAEKASHWLGAPITFYIAIFLILLWGASGFYFGFNNTWQLLINTGTTIGTFLMVILVQNTQTREARSIQLKLDELLYGTKNTRDSLMEIEEQSDAEIEGFKQEFKRLREQYMAHLKRKALQRKKKRNT